MQKQTSIYIPKPCHEDWSKLIPTQQGKFCASCSKQVIDFSLMSDNQILNFLSNQSGKLCGRFDADQLQRPLIETKIKKKKSWWMALTMPLLFLFEKTEAKKHVIPQMDTTISPIDKQPEIMGKLMYHPIKEITVAGRVVDEAGNPVGYASIVQKGTKHGVMTDTLGSFSFNVTPNNNIIVLVASYVGYEATEIKINSHQQNINIPIQLKPAPTGEVVVVGYMRRTSGLISTVTKITKFDKADTLLKRFLNISSFKTYPNPATRGGAIHLEIKEPGEYQVQLLDNQSRLMKVEEVNISAKNTTSTITIPSTIAAGTYYLCLIDDRKKKSYTEKLIIQ